MKVEPPPDGQQERLAHVPAERDLRLRRPGRAHVRRGDHVEARPGGGEVGGRRSPGEVEAIVVEGDREVVVRPVDAEGRQPSGRDDPHRGREGRVVALPIVDEHVPELVERVERTRRRRVRLRRGEEEQGQRGDAREPPGREPRGAETPIAERCDVHRAPGGRSGYDEVMRPVNERRGRAVLAPYTETGQWPSWRRLAWKRWTWPRGGIEERSSIQYFRSGNDRENASARASACHRVMGSRMTASSGPLAQQSATTASPEESSTRDCGMGDEQPIRGLSLRAREIIGSWAMTVA